MTQTTDTLIERLEAMLAGARGESDLKVGPYMLMFGIEEAISALRSTAKEVERYRETLERIGSGINTGAAMAARAALAPADPTTKDSGDV